MKAILAWRRPDGTQVDPTCAACMNLRDAMQSNEAEMVSLILNWRGRFGRRVGHTSDFDECVRAACRNPVPVDVLCALVTERVRCGSFHSWAEWTAAERVMFKSACMHANIIWSRRRRAWLGQKGLSP